MLIRFDLATQKFILDAGPDSVKQNVMQHMTEFVNALNQVNCKRVRNAFSVWMVCLFSLATGSILLLAVHPLLIIVSLGCMVAVIAMFFVFRTQFKKFKSDVSKVCEEWQPRLASEMSIENKISVLTNAYEDEMVIVLRPNPPKVFKPEKGAMIPIYQVDSPTASEKVKSAHSENEVLTFVGASDKDDASLYAPAVAYSLNHLRGIEIQQSEFGKPIFERGTSSPPLHESRFKQLEKEQGEELQITG